MLEILLLIIKVLFVLLFIAVCLLLLILCALLFVPIRYKSDGVKKDAHFCVNLKASYLKPLLCVNVCYPKEQTTSVRILGIPYKPKKKAATQEISQQNNAKKKQKKRKGSFIKDVAYYQELWQSHKDLILDVLQTAMKAISTLLPKDMRLELSYGTGMADVTGFIYAIFCVVEPYLPGEIHLEPNWTEQCLEGTYKLSGKIRLFPLIVAAIKIISNQKVRILYKKLRRV